MKLEKFTIGLWTLFFRCYDKFLVPRLTGFTIRNGILCRFHIQSVIVEFIVAVMRSCRYVDLVFVVMHGWLPRIFDGMWDSSDMFYDSLGIQK